MGETMQEPTFDVTNQATFRLARQPAKEHQEEFDGSSRSPLQRDPLAQLSCRVGDASCAGAHADTLNRAAVQPAPDALLRLQRQYGNRFVQRVVELSRSGEGPADAAPEVEQTIQQARGGGQALDHSVRTQMEPAFKADFSGVRVHTDGQADNLNRSLSARAFATGQDIFFKQGEYNPGSSTGRELLAHELTHVVQQNGAAVQTKLTVGAPGDRYEQEADQVARTVMQQEQQPVQRQSEEEEKDKEPPVQAKFAEGALQRQGEEEEKEEAPIQTKLEDSLVQRQGEEEEEKKKEVLQSKADGQVQVKQHGIGSGNIIRRWGSADHEQISTVAAQGIIEDPLFVYKVAGASLLMDFTAKRLLWTGPLFLSGISKGEGPEHGEDGNYSNTNEAAAAAQNMQAQNSHLNRAVAYQQQAKMLEKQGKPVHERGSLYNKMFRSLGDACHIAQDRGSHWEGVKGKGHDDPRTKTGWDPDNPTDNADGYRNAISNTKQLYEAWKVLTSSIEK